MAAKRLLVASNNLAMMRRMLQLLSKLHGSAWPGALKAKGGAWRFSGRAFALGWVLHWFRARF